MRRLILPLVVLLIPVALLVSMIVAPAKAANAPHHHHATFRVTAWNEKSFPRMSRAKYRHDLLGSTSGWVKSPSLVWLGSEWNRQTGETPLIRQYARGHEMRYLGVHDSGMVLRRVPRLHVGGWTTHIFHKAVARYSPERSYTKAWGRIDGFPVLFLDTHLTQGCAGPHSRHPERCGAVFEEIHWLKVHVVAPAHANGRTVIVGGDMNRNPLIRWGVRQAAARPVTLMQIAVVPARGVTAHVSRERVVSRLNSHGLWTDHKTPSAQVRLTD